jgi:hypothetical protein
MPVVNQSAQLHLDEPAVLFVAKHLTDMPGIDRVRSASVSCIQVMLDRHEVILASLSVMRFWACSGIWHAPTA